MSLGRSATTWREWRTGAIDNATRLVRDLGGATGFLFGHGMTGAGARLNDRTLTEVGDTTAVWGERGVVLRAWRHPQPRS